MADFSAFGKIPALGDFLRLGARPDFVAAWDSWLQATLVHAEAEIGPDFVSCYMAAPVWRFALPPGLAGPEGVVGVLMPSVDRVGRRFPLTLMAHTGSGEQAPLRALVWQTPVLEAAEALSLDALEDGMTRDVLSERLAGLALRPWVQQSRIETSGTSLVLSGDRPDLLCADLALDLAGGQLQRSSAWTAVIDGAARLVLTPGLPEGRIATSLFDIGGQRG